MFPQSLKILYANQLSQRRMFLVLVAVKRVFLEHLEKHEDPVPWGAVLPQTLWSVALLKVSGLRAR